MFTEERRGSFGWWPGRCAATHALVLLALLFADAADAADEVAPAPPGGSAGVVVATDMDEPAEFVPHAEEAIDLDLMFPDGDAPQEQDPSPAQPGERGARDSLVQPSSVGGAGRPGGGNSAALREPNLFKGTSQVPTPEEIEQVNEWIEEAHAIAEAATSMEEYTAVIELCQQGQASTHWATGRNYFRHLAAWAFNRRGELRVRESQAELALDDFEQAVRLDPRNWRAAHNRAVSLAQQGSLDAALRDFAHVIRIRPDYGPAYRNRGEVYYESGRYAEAVNDYTRAMEHMPQADDLFYLRADAHFRLGNLDEALADYSTSLETGDHPERLVGRAGVHALRGDFAAAIADLNRAIKADSQSALAYRAVAWILATCPDSRYRRPDKAVIAARHALRLQGNTDPLYYETLAAAYAAAGDYDQAASVQQQAIRLATGQQEQEAMQTRLALYSQNRSLVSPQPAAESSQPPPQRQSAPQHRPAPSLRSSGPAGIRQPLRAGSR